MYYKIPALIFELELKPAELLVLIGILSYGDCFAKQSVIAKRIGMRRETVNRIVKSLKDKNILVTVSNGSKITYKLGDCMDKVLEIKNKHKEKLTVRNGESLCKFFLLLLDLANKPKVGYTKKTIKMASNLLKKLKTIDYNPKEFLEKVVLNWDDIREEIKNFKGEKVLKENPSLEEICYLNEPIIEALNKIEKTDRKKYENWEELPEYLKTDSNKKIFDKMGFLYVS